MKSSNALKDFKQEYSGADNTADAMTEAVAAEVRQAYEDAYNHAFRLMVEAKRRDDYATAKGQGELIKKVRRVFSGLKDTVTAKLKAGIWEAVQLMTGTAQHDLLLMGLAAEETKKLFGPPDRDYINTVFADSFAHVAARTEHMTTAVKDGIRKDMAEVMRRAAVEGTSRKKAYRALRDKVLARDPDFGFYDRSGRRWDSQVYFDMLTRTTMANALREGYIDQLTRAKHDLVKVSSHGTKCRLCAPWEGRVLSLTGVSKDYPTLAQAKADGLFHPRCKHRLFVQNKNSNIPEQYNDRT